MQQPPAPQTSDVAVGNGEIEITRTEVLRGHASEARKFAALRTKLNKRRQDAEDALNTISQKIADVDALLARVTTLAKIAADHDVKIASQAKAVTSAVEAAEASQADVETAAENAERALVELDKALAVAKSVIAHSARVTAAAEAIEAARTEAETAAESAADSGENARLAEQQIQQARGRISQLDSEAANDRQSIKQQAAEVASVVQSLKDADKAIQSHKMSIEALREQYKSMAKEIESLLPGATTQSLAKAFEDRENEYKRPQRSYEILFLISMVALFGVGVFVVWSMSLSSANQSLEIFFLRLFERSLLVIPLVWLALYSASKLDQSRRLAENYGFKSATAKSFIGFRKVLNQLPNLREDSPARRHLNDVLSTIGDEPGRIFNTKTEDVSPLSNARRAFGGILPRRVRATRDEVEMSRGPDSSGDK